jgi:hypothetical protein
MQPVEAFLEILRSEGVRRVFGNPGTTELPLLNALGEATDLRYVLGLQEGSVVAMAAVRVGDATELRDVVAAAAAALDAPLLVDVPIRNHADERRLDAAVFGARSATEPPVTV